MANLLNISRPAYSRYENGEREPNLDTLLKISEILNTSTDYLLGKNYFSSKITQEDYILLCEIRTLSNQDRSDVLRFIKFVKSQRGEITKTHTVST